MWPDEDLNIKMRSSKLILVGINYLGALTSDRRLGVVLSPPTGYAQKFCVEINVAFHLY